MINLIDHCPVCEAGLVGFRLCSDHKTILLMCDECEALWRTADGVESGAAEFAIGHDFMVPGLNVSISSPGARWATAGEVEEFLRAKEQT